MDPRRCARAGSRDVEPWYVQGKAAYTITGPWTEANAIQSAKKDPADFDNFEFPTDQSTRGIRASSRAT